MNLFARLARNSLWILIARIGSQACMAIATFLLARRLGPAGFGEFAFIATVLLIGNTITTFGTDMFLIREIARKGDFSTLPSALILQLVLSGLFIVFILLYSPYIPNQTPDSILAMQIYSLALVPLAFFTVFTSILRGKQKMDSYAWLSFSVPFLLVIAVSIFIEKGTNVVTLAYILLAVQTSGTILAGLWCLSLFPRFWVSLHFSFARMISLLGSCLSIALITVLGILYQKLGLIMLSLLGDASMTGLFSTAARVVEAARMGHIAVFTALYPAMAHEGQTKKSQRAFNLSWRLLLIAAAGSVVFLFLLAGPLVNIFFGLDYQPSIPVLKVLSFTLIPYTVSSFLLLALLASGKEKLIVRVLTISSLVLLTLNLLFIPRFGQIGASWAMLIAEIAQMVILLLESKLNPLHKSNELLLEKGISHELPDPSQ